VSSTRATNFWTVQLCPVMLVIGFEVRALLQSLGEQRWHYCTKKLTNCSSGRHKLGGFGLKLSALG
ncbi:hypothetical protein, partial [Vibrio nomapromontoriensis]|uniref:hypothetical protein n=1 Tax=Vibrio nomapromontoriensis TaxID=2910246 RepID=UPI003D0B13C8